MWIKNLNSNNTITNGASIMSEDIENLSVEMFQFYMTCLNALSLSSKKIIKTKTSQPF